VTLEELERRVRVLEDVEAIKQLKARYCDRCDDGPYDAEGVAQLFTEDAVWEGEGFGRFVGRDAIRDFFRTGRSVFSFTIHQATNPIIEVDGDRASGRWYLLQPSTMVEGNRAIWLASHYEDEYRREGGSWLISHLKTTTRFFTPYEDGWAKTPLLG
jgi:ketosteroid isomerase-like protein